MMVFKRFAPQAGFTLVETLVVIAIIGILSGAFVISFSGARSDISQTTAVIVAAIRDTQTKAITSTRFKDASEGLANPVSRCGYGIADNNTPTQFIIYAGPNASDPAVNCSTQDRHYNAGTDKIVQTITLPNPRIELKGMTLIPTLYFYDIFYEPPNPTTWLDNLNWLIPHYANPNRIVVGPVGTDCTVNATSCRAICVYASGKIELPNSITCPGI